MPIQHHNRFKDLSAYDEGYLFSISGPSTPGDSCVFHVRLNRLLPTLHHTSPWLVIISVHVIQLLLGPSLIRVKHSPRATEFDLHSRLRRDRQGCFSSKMPTPIGKAVFASCGVVNTSAAFFGSLELYYQLESILFGVSHPTGASVDPL